MTDFEKHYTELAASPRFRGAIQKRFTEGTAYALIPESVREDLVQVVLMRAWKYRASFKPERLGESPDALASWILGIAKNARKEYLMQRSGIAPNPSVDIKEIVISKNQAQFAVGEHGETLEVTDSPKLNSRDTGVVHMSPVTVYEYEVAVSRYEDALEAGVKRVGPPRIRKAKNAARNGGLGRPCKPCVCHPARTHLARGFCSECMGEARNYYRKEFRRKGQKRRKFETPQLHTISGQLYPPPRKANTGQLFPVINIESLWLKQS